MAFIYLDHEDDGRIRCTVHHGIRPPKVRHFSAAQKKEAVTFAESHLGKRSGMVVSTLDMTPAQLDEYRAKTERLAAMLDRKEPAHGQQA